MTTSSPPASPPRRERPPTAFEHAWRSPWIRLIVFLAAAMLAWRLAGQVRSVIIDFAVAFLIAYLAHPALEWLQRRRVGRGFGVLLIVLLFAGILSLAGALLITVSAQLAQLLQTLPDLIGTASSSFDALTQRLSALGVSGLDGVRERITAAAQTYVQNLGQNIVPILQGALSSTGTVFSGLVSIGGMVGQVLLILLLSVYLMLDYSRINATLLGIFPRPWQPRVLEFTALVGTSVGGYVRGQLLIASFIGVVVWLGLTIVGIPSAAAIGFLAGAFNVVPYLGPIIGATPAILLALTLPGAGLKILLVIGVFVAANQIEGNLLSPYILSRTTDLHPVTVLLAILIGVALLGFAGALLAVPTVALGKLMLQKYYYPSRVYTEGP